VESRGAVPRLLSSKSCAETGVVVLAPGSMPKWDGGPLAVEAWRKTGGAWRQPLSHRERGWGEGGNKAG